MASIIILILQMRILRHKEGRSANVSVTKVMFSSAGLTQDLSRLLAVHGKLQLGTFLSGAQRSKASGVERIACFMGAPPGSPYLPAKTHDSSDSLSTLRVWPSRQLCFLPIYLAHPIAQLSPSS